MTPIRPRLSLALAITATLAVATLTFAALSWGQATPSHWAARSHQETGESQDHGVQTANVDKTCKACQDFYHYANGEWLKNNPIPAAYPSWNSFSALQQRNQENLKGILEKAEAGNPAAGSNDQKIGDFYYSCMNEPEINTEGVKPLDAEFEKIEAVDSVGALRSEIAHLQGMGVNALFRFSSTQDAKNSSQVIGGADQGGLGMPDRDYYLETGKKEVDEKNAKIRTQYVDHVTKMFQLLGDDQAKASAEVQEVMDIETKLAQASLTRVERRDPVKLYHKMDRSELKTLTPDFAWDSYFQDLGYPNVESVDVAVPKFFQAMNDNLKAVPLAAWKTYLRWHLVDAYAAELSQPFVDEDFNFRGRALQGTKELLPRWKRCVQATDRQLGEALGQDYVKEYFPPEAKARAQEMVANLVAALHDDLTTLPWMSEPTRQQALKKLTAFTRKIGYPDKWRDYSAFNVDRGPYVLNAIHGREFAFNYQMKKIGKPVDRAEWGMSPPTVNAYYSPERNEIVFPAGILQPPFFDPKADDASNYGGMGAVIGHEMTHGFDDEGRKFDAEGNLTDWWTPEDAKNFEARAECVQKQFDNYVVEGDLHENGKLVLGESIADLGGLTIAYNALAKDLEGKPRPEIAGYTPEQRFFLAYAQIWAANDRPEFERLMVNTNPHALDRFRAIAAPSNMPAFYKAFDCQEGDAMVRPSAIRCQIW